MRTTVLTYVHTYSAVQSEPAEGRKEKRRLLADWDKANGNPIAARWTLRLAIGNTG